MKNINTKLKPFILSVLVLGGLYIVAETNYLLFHSVAEIVSIAIAVTLFIVVINSRTDIENNGYLVLLGVAYLFVASIDFIHTLAYKGMGVFPDTTADLATQLWIGARYIEALSLIAAAYIHSHKVKIKNINMLIGIYTAVFVVFLLTIFKLDIFPSAYIEGVGLTQFKIISEYIIVGILLILLGLIYKNRHTFLKRNYPLLLKIVIFSILSELLFTFYIGVYDISNFLGHIFKILSFYYVYRIIAESLIKSPQDLLYRGLKNSEEKYKKLSKEFEIIFNNIPGLVYFKDTENNFLRVNSYLAKAHNMKPEEFEGTSVYDIYPKEEALKYWEDDKEIIDSKEPKLNVVEPWSAKEQRWVSTSKIPYIVDGKVEGIIGISLDVTEQKNKEKEIIKKEQKIRQLFDNVNDAIYLHELTEDGMPGKFIEVNDTASEMLGYKKEEFLEMSPADIDAGGNKENSSEVMKELMEKGSNKFEVKHMDKDGNIIPVEIHSHLFKIDGKKRVLSVVRDISERLEQEEKLEEHRSRLEKAMKAGKLAWWEMDLPSGKVRFNDRKAKMLGYSPDRFKHYSDFTDLLHPEDYDRAMDAMRKHLEGKKKRYEVEYRIKKKSGGYKWFRDVGAVTNTDKDTKTVTGVVIDIDDQKRMHQRQKKLQREIMKKERMYHIGKMAEGVAHEVNNPLTSILATVQLLREEEVCRKHAEDMDTLENNIQRIAKTVRGFLGFSKDRDFSMSLEKADEILDGAIEMLDKTRLKDIEIIKDYDGNIPLIKTSRFHLQEVFNNLFKNALESMEKSSKKLLKLRIFKDKKDIIISIKDTGKGIEKENMEDIFEVHYTTKGKKGTGIGLPTCRDIMDKLGGDIQVASRGKGNGAEFRVKLPIKENKTND